MIEYAVDCLKAERSFASSQGGSSMAIASRAKKVTTHTLQEMKQAGEKITMLTAYDFSMARILDAAGIDVILVGDSASNVMAGNDTDRKSVV